MGKIQIGASIFNSTDLEQEFYLYKHYGFDYIELCLKDNMEPGLNTLNTLRQFNDILPIKVGHLTDIIIDRSDINSKIEYIKMMGALNTVKTMVIHWYSDHTNAIQFFDKIEALNTLNKVAGDNGIVLTIENTTENTWGFEEVFKYLPEISMTLDVGHANLYENHDKAVEFISAFASRIQNVHLHDNFGGYKPEWDLHLPIGVGNINFADTIGALKRMNYSSTITLEIYCNDKSYYDISRQKVKSMIQSE